jgi:sirohydrochlorin ferrochelatase
VTRALLLVDHGSREREASENFARIAAELRVRRPDLAVYVAHLDVEKPTIAEAIAACARDGVTELAVHPFFLSPGRHAAQDVPNAVEAAARPYPELHVRVTAPVGTAAGIAEAILATLPPQ